MFFATTLSITKYSCCIAIYCVLVEDNIFFNLSINILDTESNGFVTCTILYLVREDYKSNSLWQVEYQMGAWEFETYWDTFFNGFNCTTIVSKTAQSFGKIEVTLSYQLSLKQPVSFYG